MAAADASLVQVSRCTPRSPMMSSASTSTSSRCDTALIAADIAHAGLQQGLGHREDTLAAEGLALAERERLHLFLEGAFHRLHLGATEATSISAPARMLPARAVGLRRPRRGTI